MRDSITSQGVAELYAEHHGWLQNWLRRRLGDHWDAADLAHDAFLRVLNRPAAAVQGGAVRGYLRKIADGLCVDLWRRRQIEQAWRESLAAHPPDLAPSPEQQAVIIETLAEVAAMLDRLPAKAARAFVLAQIEGLKYREIAGLLGVSERMVKHYMAQAMLQCALIEAGLAPR